VHSWGLSLVISPHDGAFFTYKGIGHMALKQVMWISSTGIGANEYMLLPVILQMYQKIAFVVWLSKIM
jgi:hypothetical protein